MGMRTDVYLGQSDDYFRREGERNPIYVLAGIPATYEDIRSAEWDVVRSPGYGGHSADAGVIKESFNSRREDVHDWAALAVVCVNELTTYKVNDEPRYDVRGTVIGIWANSYMHPVGRPNRAPNVGGLFAAVKSYLATHAGHMGRTIDGDEGQETVAGGSGGPAALGADQDAGPDDFGGMAGPRPA